MSEIYKKVLLAGILLIFLVPAGYKKPPPPVYLFHYNFQPGELLRYDIFLKGEGEVTLTTSSLKREPEKLVLPVQFRGRLLQGVKVDSVTAEGAAELSVSYTDFDCTITNQVRDRETTISLTDRIMRVEEAGTVKREIMAGESEFPLNDIVGSAFTMEIDRRGKILTAHLPPTPGRAFPYMKFEGLLERIQPEFPEAEIPVGTTWSREVQVTAPGGGKPWDRGEPWTIKLDSTFRGFKDRDERIALIDLSGRFEQEAGPEEEESNRSGLKRSSHALTGTVEFDIKAGRVLASQSRLKQELDILMAIERVVKGKNIQVHIDDTMEITVLLAGSPE